MPLSIKQSTAQAATPLARIGTETVACSCCGSQSHRTAATGRDYIYHGTQDRFNYVRCDDCAHFYLNPRPRIDALSLMYPANYGTFSSRFAGRLNFLGRVKTIVNRRRLRAVLAVLAPGSRVLDVGCGNGELLLALREERPDLQLFGLDWYFPPETRRALEAIDVELFESPLEAALLPDEPFDLVLMLQLIEHLWQPEESVQRLAASLSDGGRLLIETPNTDGWDRRPFAGGSWGGYYFPRHLNLYNRRRLAELLGRAGLQIETQTSLPAPLIWIYSLQAAVQQHFGWKSRLGALVSVKNLPLIAVFAFLDVAAIAFGAESSNQQAVARKTSSPAG